MTIDPRLERALPAILGELGAGAQPDYADALLERVARTRQRPAWTLPERWLPMGLVATQDSLRTVRWRPIAVVALLVVALIAAVIVISSGSSKPRPAPFGPAGNGLVAYGSNGDIYTASSATGDPKVLNVGSGYDLRAGYSPDGSTIGFLRSVDGTGGGRMDIVVANADGSNLRTITQEPLSVAPSLWAWTSDSTSIIAVTGVTGEAYRIFDAAKPAAPRIVSAGDLSLEDPAFQPPDGRHVMFRGRSGASLGLYAMDLDGANLHAIIAPYDHDTSLGSSDPNDLDLRVPTWSPDGTKIAYMMHTTGNEVRVFVMQADGTNAHVIGDPSSGAGVERIDAFPAWSPDGSRVMVGRLDVKANSYRAAIVSLADNSVVVTGPVIASSTPSSFFWSPDGSVILLVYGDEGTRNAVLVDPAGGPEREIPWTPALPIDWQRVSR